MKFLLYIVFVILLIPNVLWGIVVCDVPAEHEFNYLSPFNGVGYLSTVGGTSGVLINSNCVLTAAHAVSSISGHTFTLYSETGTNVYGINAKYVHESIDLAILKLDRNTNLNGYSINTELNEVMQTVYVVGYGNSGVGETQASLYPKGVGRYGTNQIMRIYAGLLIYEFNNNGTDVMVSFGDSGGPTFNQDMKIVGIHVGVSDYDGDGIPAEYDDRGYDARIAAYYLWIFETLANDVLLLGDANHDDVVSAGDYACVQSNFGNVGNIGIMGDADLDGEVSAGDYACIQANFGNVYTLPIPEPMPCLLFFGIFLINKRHK